MNRLPPAGGVISVVVTRLKRIVCCICLVLLYGNVLLPLSFVEHRAHFLCGVEC